jgi:hypothetical protein
VSYLDSGIFKTLAKFADLYNLARPFDRSGLGSVLRFLKGRDRRIMATNGLIGAIVTIPSDDALPDTFFDPLKIAGQLTIDPLDVDLDIAQEPLNSQFPEITKLAPKTEPVLSILVDPELLKHACELAIAVANANGERSQIRLSLHGELQPIVFETMHHDETDYEAWGLLMPIKAVDPEEEA